jgi:hypothetical protein
MTVGRCEREKPNSKKEIKILPTSQKHTAGNKVRLHTFLIVAINAGQSQDSAI